MWEKWQNKTDVSFWEKLYLIRNKIRLKFELIFSMMQTSHAHWVFIEHVELVVVAWKRYSSQRAQLWHTGGMTTKSSSFVKPWHTQWYQLSQMSHENQPSTTRSDVLVDGASWLEQKKHNVVSGVSSKVTSGSSTSWSANF